MNRGFTLIEVVIALAISSMIGLLLFSVFNQSSRSLSFVDSIVSTDMKIVSFYDRFEKDVSGAFIPFVGDPEDAAKILKKQEEQIRTRDLEREEAKEGAQEKKGAAAKPAATKLVTLADVQVKKPFIYEADGGNLKRFSFITCNPLQVYKQVKPRIARVIYELKKTKGSKNYQLMRKESKKLALKADKEAREYVLLNNIQTFKLSFLAPEPSKKEEKKKEEAKNKQASQSKKEEGEAQEQKPQPLKTYDTWPIEKEGEKDKKVHDLPQFVKISLVYNDEYEDVGKKFELIIPIFSYRAPSEAILRAPLLSQQRIKKEEIEGSSTAKSESKK